MERPENPASRAQQEPAVRGSERSAAPAEAHAREALAAAPRPRSSWWTRGGLVVGMLTSGALLLAFAWWFGLRANAPARDSLFGLWGLSLALVGRFVIFAGAVEGSALSPWTLGLMVWLTDVFLALAITGGAHALEHLPLLGRWMVRARRRAEVVLARYPRLRGMAFGGVVLLVLLPIAATGAITGAFAARLMALPPLVGTAAVAAGSALGVVVFALLAVVAGERAEQVLRSPGLAAVSLVCLGLFARWAYVSLVRQLEQEA